MAARARYLRHLDKVAISTSNKRILLSWDDAAELLAELQVMFCERQLDWDGDKEVADE